MLQTLIVALQNLKWPLRAKIGVAFAMILSCFVINGLISLVLLFNINATEEQQNRNALYTQRWQLYSLAFQSEEYLYSDTIFTTKASAVQDNFKDIIITSLKNGKDLDASQVDKEFEQQLATMYDVAYQHFIALDSDINLNDIAKAQAQWPSFIVDFYKVLEFLATEQQNLRTQHDMAASNIATTILVSTITIVSLTIFSVILALFLLFLIGRVLVNPIIKLQACLKQVAEGNLDQEIEVINRDEVGELTYSFKQAVFSLQKVLYGVQISESLRDVTRQLTLVSQQQTQGSYEQTAALSQVQQAMGELGRTASQIASSAANVATLTNTTVNQIEQVTSVSQLSQQRSHQMVVVVETTLKGVERVEEQVLGFSLLMQELTGQSLAIGKIVGLINSIARDIHLLALNAAIEAAAAGEVGSRFQMVAREVKSLALRANNATEEAQEIISRVQQSNQLAQNQVAEGLSEVLIVVEANASLRQNLQALEDSAHQVEENIATLVGLAGNVRNQTEEIKQATLYQRNSSEQVLSSTQLAASIAAQTSGNTEQLALNSTKLSELADQLNNVLGQIRLTPYHNQAEPLLV
jgi:methyl-accepting chemotaxis protein